MLKRKIAAPPTGIVHACTSVGLWQWLLTSSAAYCMLSCVSKPPCCIPSLEMFFLWDFLIYLRKVNSDSYTEYVTRELESVEEGVIGCTLIKTY